MGEHSNLHEAVVAVMEEVRYIKRTGFNSHQNYSYASDAVLKAAYQPAMDKPGLSAYPTGASVVKQDDNHVVLMYTFTLQHKSGEKVDIMVPGEGRDKGDKAVYKASTGAQKYFYHMTFRTPTGDDAECTWSEEEQFEFWTALHDHGVSLDFYMKTMNRNRSWPKPWEMVRARRAGLINKLVELKDTQGDKHGV